MLSRFGATHCVGVGAAGQYNDAAYSLVQLRKILEDSASQPGGKDVLPSSEVASLQAACASCEASLEEVRRTTRAARVAPASISVSCQVHDTGLPQMSLCL